MSTETFFKNCWRLNTPPTSRAYPNGRWVNIGKDPDLTNRFVVAWLDADGILHVFRDLKLQGGKLVGPALEVGTGKRWTVTIEQVSGTDDILGEVAVPPLRAKKGAIVEATLAGTWGADAPPPPFTDDPPRP